MIFIRAFMDKIPDTWEPGVVWYLVAIETLLEAFIIRLLILFLFHH